MLRSFQQKLERHNITPVAAKGKVFDPRVHEAVSRQETSASPPGTVVEELIKGYRLGDRLLRAASVVVAAAPSKPAEDTSETAAPDPPAGADDTAQLIMDAARAGESRAEGVDADDTEGADGDGKG